jgi:hypothetical protein
MRVPFMLDAEYRGVAPAGEYTDRETGEVRQRQPVLKFEVAMPDGDVETIELRANACDQAADFDPLSLKRGEYVHVTGVVRDGQYGVAVIPSTIRRKSGKPVAVAAA